MAQTKKSPGISTAAALLCVLAAGCTGVRSALLLLEMSAVVLLVAAVASWILRRFSSKGLSLAMSILGTALAAVMQMALLAWRPSWWEELAVIPYFLAAFLAGALAAQEHTWTESLPRYGIWAAVLLLIGGIREWLASGRLMGVRLLWDGWSVDFGVGGLGLLTAGLLLAAFGLRERHSYRYTLQESLQAGGIVFAGTALAGVIYTPLAGLSLPVWGPVFLPALLTTLVFLVLRGLAGASKMKDMAEDPALAAVGYGFLLWQRQTPAIWWQALLLLLGTGLLVGVVTAAFGAVANRLDSPGLPSAFKSAPVLLITAGVALYAFGAF